MFENIMRFFRKMTKKENKIQNSKEQAKERLHLVLMQDRANVSADFLDLMKQEIIDVIKKYIEVDEGAIDVRLTNKDNGDGTTGAPALYANIPIMKIKDELKTSKQEEVNETKKVSEKNDKEKEEIENENKNDSSDSERVAKNNEKENEEKNEINNEKQEKSETI